MKRKNIKDKTTYKVRLNAPVERGHRKHLPRDTHTFMGKVLKEIITEYGWEVLDAADPT